MSNLSPIKHAGPIMPIQTRPPPCSGYEFALRRQAVGLDNATFKALGGFSISALTKWNAGQLPVSWRAYEILEEVEVAIEREVKRIVKEMTAQLAATSDLEAMPAFSDGWEYGDQAYAIVISRARRILSEKQKIDLRLLPPAGLFDPDSSPRFAFEVPNDTKR